MLQLKRIMSKQNDKGGTKKIKGKKGGKKQQGVH